MKPEYRIGLVVMAISLWPPFCFGQDFSGAWSLYGNGYKGELYLKQQGSQIRGWMGTNGVNYWADVVTGTVTGNEIRFTRTNSALTRPQEYRGFISISNDPRIDPRHRMTGNDALAGIGSHLGEWCFGWYATRLGPYREDPSKSSGGGGGSQSFPSLGGAWSDANQAASITQDSNNRLMFTNRMGWRSNGKFADASTVIATDWEGGLRGSLQDNGNTIRWANGTVWYRSGGGGGGGQSFPTLGGGWSDANQPASIAQDSNNKLVFTNRMGWRSNGKFADASTVIAMDWEGGLRGSLQDNGNTIRWANGTVWYRKR